MKEGGRERKKEGEGRRGMGMKEGEGEGGGDNLQFFIFCESSNCLQYFFFQQNFAEFFVV